MEYSCRRLFDYVTVLNTMELLWSDIAEDDAPPYQPDLLNENWVGVFADEEYVGMYRLHQLNSVLWEIHVFMLPDKREHALAGGKEMMKWAVENLPDAKKIIANIPECFNNVIEFSKKMGFKEQGYNSDSYTKNGIVGIYQLGMTVEEMKCQQQQQ